MKSKGLYKKMLMMAVLPVLLVGVVITLFCSYRFRQALYEVNRDEMQRVARLVISEYDRLYPGDYALLPNRSGTYDLYKGSVDITNEVSIVDHLSEETDTQLSLLYMDARVNTTFKTSGGARIAGSGTNPQTTEEVLTKGNEVFYKDISIETGRYLVLYVPIYNSDGSISGMVEVARDVSGLSSDIYRVIWPLLLFAALGVGIAIFYTYHNTHEITEGLTKIQQFMNKVASGNLQAEADIHLLQRKDELGDIAKSSVSMQKSIRASVETDPLTRIGNRRYVKANLGRIMEKSESTGVRYSVALGDIDFFKKVNDTYGHNAGDDVLKTVASTLREHMQGQGFAARWGGEEFILVYDKIGAEEAYEQTDRLREKVGGLVIPSEGFEIRVTMSFGVAEGHRAEGEGAIETLVEEADERLYFAKQNGRNRVVLTIPETGEAKEEPTEIQADYTENE